MTQVNVGGPGISSLSAQLTLLSQRSAVLQTQSTDLENRMAALQAFANSLNTSNYLTAAQTQALIDQKTALPDRLKPTGKEITDCDTAVEDGWYWSRPAPLATLKGPPGSDTFFTKYYAESVGSPASVTLYSTVWDGVASTSLRYFKTLYNGSWSPWERTELSEAEVDAKVNAAINGLSLGDVEERARDAVGAALRIVEGELTNTTGGAYTVGQWQLRNGTIVVASGVAGTAPPLGWSRAVDDAVNTITLYHVVSAGGSYEPSTGLTGGTCFPPGAQVLMSDGTSKAIEAVAIGDLVWSPLGPETVNDAHTVTLGNRRLFRFAEDTTHAWSEEHAHWVRRGNDQRLWSMSVKHLMEEAKADAIIGLKDWNWPFEGQPDRTETFARADTTWVDRTPQHVRTADPDTRLHFVETKGGGLISVNGYLVGAGLDADEFDYHAFKMALPPAPPDENAALRAQVEALTRQMDALKAVVTS
jgi:hypothetical protein